MKKIIDNTTNNPCLTWYILPDGQYLYSTFRKPDGIHRHITDHDQIAYDVTNGECNSQVTFQREYHMIRIYITPNGKELVSDVKVKPTHEQIKSFASILRDVEWFGIRYVDEDDNVFHFEKNNPQPWDIHEFIEMCW